jgi:hypothetical protein
MAFLDPKEQVLDVQLTQYGKILLSKGQLKPAFYSFDDSTILYDSLYAGITSSQGENVDRIKSSPQFDTQYILQGVESSFKNLKHDLVSGTPTRLDKPEENLFSPIGDSSPNYQTLPALAAYFLNGQISGSVNYLSSSLMPNVRIPQLDADITFNIFTGTSDDSGTVIEADRRDYDDGTFISVEQNYILLELEEVNTNFENENFEIEVFEVSNEKLVQNLFAQLKDPIGDLLIVEPLGNKKRIILETNDVEYSWNILVDSEIDQQIICKSLQNRKNSSIFVPSNPFCKDKKPLQDQNIYKTPADDFDEECEF